MAVSTPVSTPIADMLEQLGAAMSGTGPVPSAAALYSQLIRIRDEAVLLEVRATARDAKVRELLAELGEVAEKLDRLQVSPPVWWAVDIGSGDASLEAMWLGSKIEPNDEAQPNTLVALAARRSGKSFAMDALRKAAAEKAAREAKP